MKTIIVTIKPCFLNDIRRGKKTIEIRKTAPEPPFRVLCCESRSHGRITAEFVCNSVLPIVVFDNGSIQHWNNHKLERAQISYEEMARYIGYGKTGYAWQITDVIDYCSTTGHRVRNISEFGLKRPPQSWQYLREEGGASSE